MTIVSLGKLSGTPGVPVALSPTRLMVWRVRIQTVIGETGRVFLGDRPNFNKANATGVIKEFWPTGAGGGVADFIEFDAGGGGNTIDLNKLYLDVNVGGEGAIVTYWQR